MYIYVQKRGCDAIGGEHNAAAPRHCHEHEIAKPDEARKCLAVETLKNCSQSEGQSRLVCSSHTHVSDVELHHKEVNKESLVVNRWVW